MHFLLLNQFFPPDPAPTGQFLADLADHLAEQGHQVTVVCGRSCYAGSNGTSASEPEFLHRAVRVIRVPGLPFAHGSIARLSSWLSFFVGAIWNAFRVPRPDIVLTLTTPPLLASVGTLLRFPGVRHIIWEMDLYPDVATSLNALRPGSILDRAIGAVADYSRSLAESVIALGPCMRERLIARGIPRSKIQVAENWSDGSQIRRLPHIVDGRLKILYSGNFGLAHDADTITEAIMWLAGQPQFSFTFAGGGPRRNALENACREYDVTNVRFQPYCDAGDLSEHLGACDIGLVTQNPATLGCVVPSKTYAIMAAGRPILYIGPREATPALNIERFRCGWQIDPGDVDGLVSLLQLLASKPELVREAGQRAREAFVKHYDRPVGVARICEILGVQTPLPSLTAEQ